MPINLPTVSGFRSITWIPEVAVAQAESPFTLKRQVYDYGSSRWKAIVKLPPMTRTHAAEWVAFFASVRGQEFYLSDTSTSDVSTSETPTVLSTISSGSTIPTTGWTASTANVLSAGDWFDMGAAIGKRTFFQVTSAVSSDSSGNATIAVFPSVRTAIASGAALNFSGPKGVFLIDDIPALKYNADKLLEGVSFECSQVQ